MGNFFNKTPLVAPSELFQWIPGRNSLLDNCSILKTFECSFPIDFAFNMPYDAFNV